MITKKQVEAIMDYIEMNYEYLGEILATYNVDCDRFANIEMSTDSELQDCVNSIINDEFARAIPKENIKALYSNKAFEHRKAQAMFDMAEGFALAIILQKINNGIFN